MKFKDLIFHTFTGADNKTIDIGRILWAMSVVSFLVMGFYGIWKGQVMDYLAFGTGIAAVMAAGGAALGMKANSEPKPESKPGDPTE
jgi:hypothetical protein